MSEVRVIARFVANKGNEDQLKNLLQGMLTPHLPSLVANGTNFTNQTPEAAFTCMRLGKARRRLINT